MFQALPQRHANRAHQPHGARAAAANDHHGTLIHTSSLSHASSGPLHCDGDSQQPHAESVALSEALGKAQGATQEVDFSVQQHDSSTTPHSHHAFRLSFSPTGIPTVEPDQHLGSWAPPLEAPLEPRQNQSPQIHALEPDHHLCTNAVSLAPGSITDSLACSASGAAAEASQPSGITAVPVAKPKATAGTTPPVSLCSSAAAPAECSIISNRGDGGDPRVQAGAPQLQQLSKPSPAGADCSKRQAASAQTEAEAGVEDVAVATGSPAQLELPHGVQASTPASQPAAQSAVESVSLPAGAIRLTMPEAQAWVSLADDAEGRLQSCTPGGPPCPRGLPPPSTPMLAWLDALGTPGSTLLSDVIKPSHGGKAVGLGGEEQVPLVSAVQALMDESTPGLLAASPQTPSEAVLHAVSSPVVLARACADLPPLSSSLLPLLADALSETASSVPRAAPNQAMPGPLPNQAMLGPLPNQAMPEPLPDQATPMPASNIPRKSVQATPPGWPKRATPHMGPPTGLSGLTTPASASEMHRYEAHRQTCNLNPI